MSIVTRALTLMVLVVILLTAEAKGRVLKSQKLGGKSEKAGKEGKESNSSSKKMRGKKGSKWGKGSKRAKSDKSSKSGNDSQLIRDIDQALYQREANRQRFGYDEDERDDCEDASSSNQRCVYSIYDSASGFQCKCKPTRPSSIFSEIDRNGDFLISWEDLQSHLDQQVCVFPFKLVQVKTPSLRSDSLICK